MAKKVKATEDLVASMYVAAIETAGIINNQEATNLREEFELPKTDVVEIIAGNPEVGEAIAEAIVGAIVEEKIKKEKTQLVLCNINGADYLFETHLPIKEAQKLLSKKAKSIFVTPKDKYDNRITNDDFLKRYAKQISRMEQLGIQPELLEQFNMELLVGEEA